MKCERCGEKNPAEIHTCTPTYIDRRQWLYDPMTGEVIPLYTAPLQREWQGLTDEEILEEYRQSYGDDGNLTDVYFARAIEAALKAKNA